MRIASILLPVALALPSGAMAQHAGMEAMLGQFPTPGIDQIWAEFDQSCSGVLADTASFIADHPRTDAEGHAVFTSSPDGLSTVLYNQTESGVFRQIEILEVGGFAHILCDVSGLVTLEIMFGEGADTEALNDALAEDVRTFVRTLRDAEIVGGRVLHYRGNLQLHGFGGDFDGDFGDHSDTTNIMGAVARIGGLPRFIWIGVEGGDVRLVSMNMVPSEALGGQ